MPGGIESFNMVDITDKSVVSEENQIPVPENRTKKNKRRNMKSWWRTLKVNASSRTASPDLAR